MIDTSPRPDNPQPEAEPPVQEGSSTPKATIRLQKQAPGPATGRQKLCEDCGRPFELTDEQKFFICPSCYRRRQSRKGGRRGEAQVLIQITCVGCGAVEYLDFMPQDPTKALCRACYQSKRREPENAPDHLEPLED